MTIAPPRRVVLGQAKGPDVELHVEGDEWYATYETPAGDPAVYDDRRGLFCYARIENGRFESTGVPISDTRPPDAAPPHARETPEVRAEKAAAQRTKRAGQARKETP